MNSRWILYVTAMTFPFSGGALSGGERLERIATADTRIERSFAEESTWGLDTIELSLDGAPVDQELPEVQGVARRSLGLTERVAEAEDGWPLAFERDFDELAADTELSYDGGAEVHQYTTTSVSPLEGLTLAFTWDAESESYERELVDAEASAEFLAGVTARLDLGGFLPGEEVSEGDTWELEPGVMAELLQAGGSVGLGVREYVPGSLFTIPSGAILASSFVALGQAGGEFTGEVEARLDGIEEGIASIRVSFEGECTSELSEPYTGLLSAAQVSEEDAELSFLYELEGEFEIAWDLANGGPVAAEGELAFYLTAELAWTEEALGLVQSFSGLFEASGQTRVEASAERD